MATYNPKRKINSAGTLEEINFQAKYDGDGNEIVATYATKEELGQTESVANSAAQEASSAANEASSASSLANEAKTAADGASSQVASMQTEVSDLNSRVTTLENNGGGGGSSGLELTYDIGMPGQTITYTAAELSQYKVIEASSLSSDQAQQMTVAYYSVEDPDTQTDVDCICIRIYILPMGGGAFGFGFISTIATGTNITTHTFVDYNLNNTHPITFTGTNTTPFFIAKYK